MERNTVLVVEDDPLTRLDAAAVFREAGFTTVEFDSADDALAYAWDDPLRVAAIFTDVQMPGHSDGLHLADVIARHWPHILVLVTSGRCRPVDPLPCNVRFMVKPWQAHQVLSMVRDSIGS